MKTKQNKKSNSQNQKSKTENKKPNKSLVWFDFSLIFILYSSLSFFAHPRTEIASGRRGEIGDSLCVLSQGADSLASTVREYNEFLEFRIRTMKGVDTNEMIHQVSQKQKGEHCRSSLGGWKTTSAGQSEEKGCSLCSLLTPAVLFNRKTRQPTEQHFYELTAR